MSAAPLFGEEVDDEVVAAVADVARAVFAGHAAAARTDLLGALGKSGLLGLGVPQDQGGSGGSALLAALVAEQAGAALIPPDMLHQWVGVMALAAAGADVEDVAAASAGALPILVGFTAARATEVSVPFVVDSELLLLCTNAGLVTSPAAAVDLTRRAADCWHAPDWWETMLAVSPTASTVPWQTTSHRDVCDVAGALAAMYMIGAAADLLSQTAAYAGVRTQFGAPIGSFQAVKHSLADAWIGLHHARELVVGALTGRAAGVDGLSLAALAAGAAAQGSAERCLQAMGGIGFTWESDVHRYLKATVRLRHWPVPEQQRRRELRAALLPSR
jgi:alkylation response protein AidB-like acyl-CoA dehydrogenase